MISLSEIGTTDTCTEPLMTDHGNACNGEGGRKMSQVEINKVLPVCVNDGAESEILLQSYCAQAGNVLLMSSR